MKINWLVRVKNKAFWAALIPAVLLLVQAVAALIGVSIDLGEIGDKLLQVVNAIFTVLAILGNARHYLHQERAVSRFFTQRSYALYVVHYPVLLLTASLLTERTTLPAALMYLLTLVIGFGATLGLSEVICRIPGIRYLVLGIRKEKKA